MKTETPRLQNRRCEGLFRSRSRRGLVAAGAISAFGVILTAIHLHHLISHDKPLLSTVIGAVIPLLLAIGVVYTGYRAYRKFCRTACLTRLCLWTFGGAVAMAGMAGLIIAHQFMSDTSMVTDAPYLLANSATGGALGGNLIGLYEVRNRRKANRIETIHAATRGLMTARTRSAVCQEAVETARDGLEMRLTGIWLYDEERDSLRLVAATDEGLSLVDEPPEYERGNSLSWEVFATGEPRLVSDVSSEGNAYNPDSVLGSELILPLGDHGVLNVGATRANAFDRVDRLTASILAATTTAALDRAEREEVLRTQHRKLRRQSAQLEDVAATVSHDLRNPLSVAFGLLETVRELLEKEGAKAVDQTAFGPDWSQSPVDSDWDGRHHVQDDVVAERDPKSKSKSKPESKSIPASDPESKSKPGQRPEPRTEEIDPATDVEAALDETEAALYRMKEIIENILWLSREGRQIDTQEDVDLSETARSAWRFVETADARLQCPVDGVAIRADPARLQQLFENLFRNAVEHGGSDVTVTVGVLEDGFFVEDTGLGIPPAKRDEVFEAGYTSQDAGTGYGLSIVETICEAHGWEITATTGTDGGARFEVMGVTMVGDEPPVR